MAKQEVDLSIIIVNWNARDLLRGCLKSVYSQAEDLALEVLVVDNASSDGSIEMVRDEFRQAIRFANSTNLGFPAANNQAIVRSAGRHVLLLNPDTVVRAGTLRQMVEYVDAHQDVGALGPKLVHGDGTVQLSCARNFPGPLNYLLDLTFLSRGFPRSRLFGRYLMGYWDHNSSRAVDCITGACMLLRRSVLNCTGLLDDSHFMYHEDVDICYRIKQAGFKVFYLHTAEVLHFWRGSSMVADDQVKLEMIGWQAALIIAGKHQGFHKYVLTWLVLVLGFAFRAVGALAVYLASLLCGEGQGMWRVQLTRQLRLLQWALTYPPSRFSTARRANIAQERRG